MLNEAYSRVEYRLEREGFDSVPALIRYYVGNRKPVSQVSLYANLSFEKYLLGCFDTEDFSLAYRSYFFP